jgi:tRNA(Ile2) C34 agmatinyltransferase TiaS
MTIDVRQDNQSTSIRASKKTKIRFNLKKELLQAKQIQRLDTDDDVINYLLDQSDYYERVFSPKNPVCPTCGVKPVDYPGQTCNDCWAEEREQAERFLEEKDSLEEGESINERGEVVQE